MGMYNVQATILNMLGLSNKYNVGDDIFSVKNDNLVVFPNGNILTDKMYYNNSTGEYARIENGIINRDKKDLDETYIKKLTDLGEKRLEVSNSIIVYDLLDRLNENGD